MIKSEKREKQVDENRWKNWKREKIEKNWWREKCDIWSWACNVKIYYDIHILRSATRNLFKSKSMHIVSLRFRSSRLSEVKLSWNVPIVGNVVSL